MSAGLAVCREYGQPLTWWLGLDPGEQAIYLADHEARSQKPRARR